MHLQCLRWCGFVTSERRGKYVYYRVRDERVQELLTWPVPLPLPTIGSLPVVPCWTTKLLEVRLYETHLNYPLSAVWRHQRRSDAHRCLPILLPLHEL